MTFLPRVLYFFFFIKLNMQYAHYHHHRRCDVYVNNAAKIVIKRFLI